MRKIVLSPVLGCLFFVAAPLTAASASEQLTIVELFTSQSCPNSPKGDHNLTRLAEEEDVLALTYPVTYWNYLGWADTLAQSEFDQRQKDYLRSMPDQWLYTPQLVVDGRIGVNGDDMDAVQTSLEAARTTTKARLDVKAANGKTTIMVPANDLAADAVVTMVTWQPGMTSVEVTGGKNRGKVLTYANVVKSVTKLSTIAPTQTQVVVETEQTEAEGCVYLLQDAASMEILAVARCGGASV
jgi:hypothetical protein